MAVCAGGVDRDPHLIFLGVATFARRLETAVEDAFDAISINRIRHACFQLSPALRAVVRLSDRDDMSGMPGNMGVTRAGTWQMLLTAPGMIGVINSVLIGSFVAGLALVVTRLPLEAAIGLGVVVFALSVVLHVNRQRQAWFAFSATCSAEAAGDEVSVHIARR